MSRQASTSHERTPFALCADDYGLSPAVSRGVLRLLEAGRLTAASAMSNRPSWPAAAAALAPFVRQADLGLHLNLTCGAPLGAMPAFAPAGSLPPLRRAARLAAASRAARREIAAEIGRQIEAFAQAMGKPPDFIDGHQHVHAFMGVRGALLAALAAGGMHGTVWLRDPADRPERIRRRGGPATKALMVAALAGGFGAAARRRGFATNRGFSGFSAFRADADYGAEFGKQLQGPGAAHLVMCHPGEIDAELVAADPIVATRPRELAFFLSERFGEICDSAGMRLMRMSEMIRQS